MGEASSGLDRMEAGDWRTILGGAISPENCSMASLGSPWISSAPEQHLSWQGRLRLPFPQNQCASGAQNSSVHRSWSGRSVSSSSSAGVSPPHSILVCARIHSCSLMVPVSLWCWRAPGGSSSGSSDAPSLVALGVPTPRFSQLIGW